MAGSSATTAGGSCRPSHYSRDEPWACRRCSGNDEALERGLEREVVRGARAARGIGAVKAVVARIAVVLLETELSPDGPLSPSAEVSEVAGVDPTAVGQLTR